MQLPIYKIVETVVRPSLYEILVISLIAIHIHVLVLSKYTLKISWDYFLNSFLDSRPMFKAPKKIVVIMHILHKHDIRRRVRSKWQKTNKNGYNPKSLKNNTINLNWLLIPTQLVNSSCTVAFKLFARYQIQFSCFYCTWTHVSEIIGSYNTYYLCELSFQWF